MAVDRLNALPDGATIEADVIIVGGGACGLTLARELSGRGLAILVIESGGIDETPEHSALNRVEVTAETWTDAARAFRSTYHSTLARYWDAEVQQFGVRCRGLGGSTLAWVGKSAPFDDIDLAERDWVAGSGWPMTLQALWPHVMRAARALNLGPPINDDGLWQVMGQRPPRREFDHALLRPFYWQFARGTIDSTDAMRLGAEFLAADPPDIRVLTDATVTRVETDPGGQRFAGVDLVNRDGRRARARAPVCVLAAGAIENARLLLVSGDIEAGGLGNRHDLVGRYLTDHPLTLLGRFDADAAHRIERHFGFVGLRRDGHSHMYAQGLALPAERQRDERLLNGALFFLEERAPDDPVSALGRLLRGRSARMGADLAAVARSPGQILRGVGLKALQSDLMPDRLRSGIADMAVRFAPNAVADTFRYRGVPHKLTGMRVEAITEQAPDPANRVRLSAMRDALGVPLPQVHWTVGQTERRSLMRQAALLTQVLGGAGLPLPAMSAWIRDGRPDAAVLTDLGHPMGTTRMADDPRRGVVNADGQVHDVAGLYLAGGSVMPTAGHANPTLMMLALTMRLADHLAQMLKH